MPSAASVMPAMTSAPSRDLSNGSRPCNTGRRHFGWLDPCLSTLTVVCALLPLLRWQAFASLSPCLPPWRIQVCLLRSTGRSRSREDGSHTDCRSDRSNGAKDEILLRSSAHLRFYDRPPTASFIICRPAGDNIPFPTPGRNQMPTSLSGQ